MKKYKVKIKTPNHMIIWRGKQTRTPVELTVLEKELSNIKLLIKSLGIENYNIIEYDKSENNCDFNIPEIINKEIVNEENINIDNTSKSILDKLLKGE